MKRSLTGIRATGDAHLGNYLGMMRPALDLQSQYECLYFIADMHALTTSKDREALEESCFDLVALWRALGLDTDKHLLYRQSDLPQVTELSWYLSCVTGMGFLQKAHSYKDAVAKNKEVNHGVFYYPVLMASDILLYDADVVPVGKDQKQHVEMARDMAQSLNNAVGEEVLKLPEPSIREDVMVIPGLDGQKMSKSYGNTIPLMSTEKALRKKVMSITTDSTPMEAPKELEGSLLGDLFKLFATSNEYDDLKSRLLAGGLGWGHAKEELFDAINREITPIRDRYLELKEDRNGLAKTLNEGKERAFAISQPILNRVRKSFGFFGS